MTEVPRRYHLVLLVFVLIQIVSTKSASIHAKDRCNPNADIIFMLDGHSNVTTSDFQKQKLFIRDILERHEAPTGAVQVGVVVCSNSNITKYNFKSSVVDVLENLDKYEKIKEEPSKHNSDKCVSGVNSLFVNSGRTHVTKIAILLIGDNDSWNDKLTTSQVNQAKSNDVSFLVITTGDKDFDRLHALRNIASDDGKFFVLSSYNGLGPLSSDLSTGSCLPISLDLSEHVKESAPVLSQATSTTTPSTIGESCRKKEGLYYEQLIPFFGWIREQCNEGYHIELLTCQCVADKVKMVDKTDITKHRSTTDKTDITKHRSTTDTTPLLIQTNTTNINIFIKYTTHSTTSDTPTTASTSWTDTPRIKGKISTSDTPTTASTSWTNTPRIKEKISTSNQNKIVPKMSSTETMSNRKQLIKTKTTTLNPDIQTKEINTTTIKAGSIHEPAQKGNSSSLFNSTTIKNSSYSSPSIFDMQISKIIQSTTPRMHTLNISRSVGNDQSDILTLFSLLHLENTNSSQNISKESLSNTSKHGTDDSTLSNLDLKSHDELDSALISILDNELNERRHSSHTPSKYDQTKKSIEKIANSSQSNINSTIESLKPLPKLPLSLNLATFDNAIENAIDSLSNSSDLLSLDNPTGSSSTIDNKTEEQVQMAHSKLISLLQVENSVQTAMISLLKNTTQTKSEILDNYTRSADASLPVLQANDSLTTNSVLKNTSAQAALISLLNLENTLQSTLITILNKENKDTFPLHPIDTEYGNKSHRNASIGEILNGTKSAKGGEGSRNETKGMAGVSEKEHLFNDSTFLDSPAAIENYTASELIKLFKTEQDLDSALSVLLDGSSDYGAIPDAFMSNKNNSVATVASNNSISESNSSTIYNSSTTKLDNSSASSANTNHSLVNNSISQNINSSVLFVNETFSHNSSSSNASTVAPETSSVTSGHIETSSVTSGNIETSSVTSGHIETSSVTSGHIETSSVVPVTIPARPTTFSSTEIYIKHFSQRKTSNPSAPKGNKNPSQRTRVNLKASNFSLPSKTRSTSPNVSTSLKLHLSRRHRIKGMKFPKNDLSKLTHMSSKTSSPHSFTHTVKGGTKTLHIPKRKTDTPSKLLITFRRRIKSIR